MLKVLVASNYASPNIYVKSIVDELRQHCDVVCSKPEFWESENRYDVVHIQWVEELFNWQIPTAERLEAFKARILFWKGNQAKIVLTRHNEQPHLRDRQGLLLYQWAFDHCDAVIHLGQFSLKHFATKNAVNVVIEHPNYLEFYEEISLRAARQKVGFPAKGLVYLSFGVIRDAREEMQVIDAFKKLPAGNHLYICNSMLVRRRFGMMRPVAYLKHKIKVILFKKSNVHLLEGRIGNDVLKYYFNAADVIVTPRIQSLNSGVVYMSFSFAKPVIGPDIGNIGPLLKKTGNPVFLPNDTKSLAKAMREVGLNGKNIGARNFEYAKNECDPKKIAVRHTELYQTILRKA